MRDADGAADTATVPTGVHTDGAVLAGPIALMKLQATKMLEFVGSEAHQIFGGRAVTKGGMGGVLNRLSKSNKFFAIYGGSEEIMADLGIKQSMVMFPANAKL